MANKNKLGAAANKLFSPVVDPTPSTEMESTSQNETITELSTAEIEKLKSLADVFTTEKRKKGRPSKSEEEKKNSPDERTSVIIDKVQLAKIREIAYKEKLTQKAIFYLALGRLIETYEEKHGVITPSLHDEQGDINSIF